MESLLSSPSGVTRVVIIYAIMTEHSLVCIHCNHVQMVDMGHDKAVYWCDKCGEIITYYTYGHI